MYHLSLIIFLISSIFASSCVFSLAPNSQVNLLHLDSQFSSQVKSTPEVQSLSLEEIKVEVEKDTTEQTYPGNYVQSEDFVAKHHKDAKEDPETYWKEAALKLDWMKPFSKVKNVKWSKDEVDIRWFEDGTLNASFNCLDRHLEDKGDQVALYFEGNTEETSHAWTYRELYEAVCQFSHVLTNNGVKKGDVVTFYMPSVPEAMIAMLACSRIGAVHSIVFGGFSASCIADRMQDGNSKFVVTSYFSYRGKQIPIKSKVDEAIEILKEDAVIKVLEKVNAVCTLEKKIILNDLAQDKNLDWLTPEKASELYELCQDSKESGVSFQRLAKDGIYLEILDRIKSMRSAEKTKAVSKLTKDGPLKGLTQEELESVYDTLQSNQNSKNPANLSTLASDSRLKWLKQSKVLKDKVIKKVFVLKTSEEEPVEYVVTKVLEKVNAVCKAERKRITDRLVKDIRYKGITKEQILELYNIYQAFQGENQYTKVVKLYNTYQVSKDTNYNGLTKEQVLKLYNIYRGFIDSVEIVEELSVHLQILKEIQVLHSSQKDKALESLAQDEFLGGLTKESLSEVYDIIQSNQSLRRPVNLPNLVYDSRLKWLSRKQDLKKKIVGEEDVFMKEEMKQEPKDYKPQEMNAEDPFFILYTSGSTGKPKGIVHTIGGYLTYASHTFNYLFPLNNGGPFLCTADIGWITGHTYVTYGPLLNGKTTLVIEGVPNLEQVLKVIDKYKVEVLYTAPTALRAMRKAQSEYFKKGGSDIFNNFDLSSLTTLGSVGEPIDEATWKWYYDVIGKNRCAILDTYWQTETGAIILAPQPPHRLKPGSAIQGLPGIEPVILDEDGQEIKGEGEGYLCIKTPWPGQMRTVKGNHKRLIETYFSRFDGYYMTGDYAQRDSDGYMRIRGRTDDIIIVSGHNIGSADIETALSKHEDVSESAVIGVPDGLKGETPCAFVVLKEEAQESLKSLKVSMNELLKDKCGAHVSLDHLIIVEGVPKTRSGKIVRRILRKIWLNQSPGDITTIENSAVVEKVQKTVQEYQKTISQTMAMPLFRSTLETVKENKEKGIESQVEGQTYEPTTAFSLSQRARHLLTELVGKDEAKRVGQLEVVLQDEITSPYVTNPSQKHRVLASNQYQSESYHIQINIDKDIEDMATLANLTPEGFNDFKDFIILNELIQALYGMDKELEKRVQIGEIKELNIKEKLSLESSSQVLAMMTLLKLKKGDLENHLKSMNQTMNQIIGATREFYYEFEDEVTREIKQVEAKTHEKNSYYQVIEHVTALIGRPSVSASHIQKIEEIQQHILTKESETQEGSLSSLSESVNLLLLSA